VLDGNGKTINYDTDETADKYGIHLVGDLSNITIENFNGEEEYGKGIWLMSGGSSKAYGIYAENSLTNSNIINNLLEIHFASGIVIKGASSGNVISNNNLVARDLGCRDEDYSCSGIVFADLAQNNEITANTIVSSGSNVIYFVLASSMNTLSNNNIRGATIQTIGIRFTSSSLDVLLNNIVNSGYYGLYFDSSSSDSLTGNSITSPNYCAIHFNSEPAELYIPALRQKSTL